MIVHIVGWSLEDVGVVIDVVSLKIWILIFAEVLTFLSFFLSSPPLWIVVIHDLSVSWLQLMMWHPSALCCTEHETVHQIRLHNLTSSAWYIQSICILTLYGALPLSAVPLYDAFISSSHDSSSLRLTRSRSSYRSSNKSWMELWRKSFSSIRWRSPPLRKIASTTSSSWWEVRDGGRATSQIRFTLSCHHFGIWVVKCVRGSSYFLFFESWEHTDLF